jgi:hypothetical protein
MAQQATPDPSWEATRADLARLAWVLGLLWLALGGLAAFVQRFLGWSLAAGLIGGAALLFTLGLLLVVVGALAASMLERWWTERRERRR